MTEKRTGLVLSGGGARGAYEAGVLGYLFEHVYPRLGAGFEFDIISGTSVGAVHAAITAATASPFGFSSGSSLVRFSRLERESFPLALRSGG